MNLLTPFITVHVGLPATAFLEDQHKPCHRERKSSTKCTSSKQYTKHNKYYTSCGEKMENQRKNTNNYQQKEPDCFQHGRGSTLIDWLICSPVWDLCLGPEDSDFTKLRAFLYRDEFEKQKGGDRRKTLTYMLKTACGKVWKRAQHIFGPTVILALTFSLIQGLLQMVVFEVIAYHLLPCTTILSMFYINVLHCYIL